MIKELGLVVTGFAIGVGVTLYYTKDYIVEGFAHKLSDVMEEEIQDMKDAKDEVYNEQVEKDGQRDYTEPLRKSGKYPWGVHTSSNYGRSSKTFIEVAFPSRNDAEQTLSTLEDIIRKFDKVSIADYYANVEIDSNYKDHMYGWTDLSDTLVLQRDGGEFVIKLPIAYELNK